MHVSKMIIPIYICNFNTTQLTNNAIRSIMNVIHNFEYEIFIIDNSDKIKFQLAADLKANVLDNTQNQLIHYEYVLKHNFKIPSPNNYASAKHTYAIDWIIKNCYSDKILLFDSDIILEHDIDFISDDIITAANVLKYTKFQRTLHRFQPFIQYFNVKMMNAHQINYYDPYRLHGGVFKLCDCYDTGASFYEDVILHNVPYKTIDWPKYIKHLEGGSWMQIFGNEYHNKRIEKFNK